MIFVSYIISYICITLNVILMTRALRRDTLYHISQGIGGEPLLSIFIEFAQADGEADKFLGKMLKGVFFLFDPPFPPLETLVCINMAKSQHGKVEVEYGKFFVKMLKSVFEIPLFW